ncbi:hypothetical protein BCR32DRAFT_292703 [Anaeromyces robustus]|uniref:Uncharacterized protein n=1 Tax=Anaeromyces robustus TaxID=1754192 RepID=A0A1Y1X9F5_9FUNG|nr:hypothetical protein BCR32DRAFT_292703 [Anaeromyces robustus]|eukprot:ORX82390.1 hypothetical protein BCR32DRAFT_292703 [Anaeromyces robustus]
MCKINFFIVLYIYIIIQITWTVSIPVEVDNYCPPGIECNDKNINNSMGYRKKFNYKSDVTINNNSNNSDVTINNNSNNSNNLNNSNNSNISSNSEFNSDNNLKQKYKYVPTMGDNYPPTENDNDANKEFSDKNNNLGNNRQTPDGTNEVQTIPQENTNDYTPVQTSVPDSFQSTNQNINKSTNSDISDVTDTSNTQSEEKIGKDYTKKKPGLKNKGVIIFLLITLLVIIVLILGLFIYKKNNNKAQVEEVSIEPEFKTGNLLEKIQAMKEMEEMNEMKNSSQGTLLNYNVLNPELSSIQSSSREISLNNALNPTPKITEQYSRMYDSMNRGLKPPPSRDNFSNKKNNKNLKNGSSPLVISTNRKSKYSDSSKSQNTNSECFSISRTSTDISQCITPTTSHSSNGIFYGYGYKNNKLNKHSSVALTFGCPSVSEKEEDYTEGSLCSPTHTSYNISSNHSSSRLSSRLSSSRISSPRSLTSFIANSPITQSFKSRISTLYNRHYTNDRRIYNEPERTNYMDDARNKNQYISVTEFGNNVKFDNTAENHKTKNNVNTNKDFDASSPADNTFMYENSTDLLIDDNKYVSSFMNGSDKKLDLSLKNYQ